MKKALNLSLIYAIAAMAAGVFYREFTKFCGYEGITALGKVHTHLFMLGMFLFLIIALFCDRLALEQNRKYRVFLCLYNIGVPLASIMMFLRGIFQVLGTELSKGADASISGISGIGHILIGAGLVLLLLALRQCAVSEKQR